ncbi:hypothetical protein NEF87_004104 [Candidatus Lokiarchaeum ossiferum]|uniref:WD40 repeat domain-containing protein n=1 Tax=Candidatus Lokiarchaeum ossiferum TaxID=2951803 RepID=A0ABY6HZE4_9ARCH|nr:hypothetical protein NEF87_004104 [Candidatus Lokiarchaeum sp. B-35]
MYIPKVTNGRMHKPMIIQHVRSVFRKKFKGVVRCFDVGIHEGEQFLALGSQDKHLYILNSKLEIMQAIEFPQWVRCVTTGDLNDNGNSEIVVGCGDHTLRVYQSDNVEYHEIYSTKFDGFVTSCAIADLTGNGKSEIIAGSWDKTVRAFSIENSELSLLWQQEFSAGIQYLKADDLSWDQKPEVICLFKGHSMAILDGTTGSELWNFETTSELKTCDVGILDYRGYPTLVVGSNDHHVYFFNHKGNLIQQSEFDDRITSLLITDLTGNGRNEIILGIGQKSIETIDFINGDITDFDVRWSRRIHGVILNMKSVDFNLDGYTNLLVAGYDCAICGLQDNYFGEQVFDPIPPAPYFGAENDASEDNCVENSALFCSDNDVAHSLGVTESNSEKSDTAETIPIPDSDSETGTRSEDNNRQDKQTIPESSSDGSPTEPPASEITPRTTDTKKSNDTRNDSVLDTSPPKPESTRFFKKPDETSENLFFELNSSDIIFQKIVPLFQDQTIYTSKAVLFNVFRQQGIEEKDLDPLFEDLKSRNVLQYSRSSPRGWHTKKLHK